jgi:hypothetical protein
MESLELSNQGCQDPLPLQRRLDKKLTQVPTPGRSSAESRSIIESLANKIIE